MNMSADKDAKTVETIAALFESSGHVDSGKVDIAFLSKVFAALGWHLTESEIEMVFGASAGRINLGEWLLSKGSQASSADAQRALAKESDLVSLREQVVTLERKLESSLESFESLQQQVNLLAGVGFPKVGSEKNKVAECKGNPFAGMPKMTYEDAFELVGGSGALQKNADVSQQLQSQTGNPELSQLVQDLLPQDPSLRRGYSVGPVFQHFVADFNTLYQKAASVLQGFHERIVKCASESNGKVLLAPLKSELRSRMKAAFKYISQDTGVIAWYRLSDLVRATVFFDDIDSMYAGLRVVINEFQGSVRELNDRYLKGMPGGYRDLQLVVQHGGVLCEIQINTAPMLQAKETSGHRTYDVQREIEATVLEGNLDRTIATLDWGFEHLGRSTEELARVVNYSGKGNSTLLHHSARCGRADIAYHLLEHQADANVVDDHGNTPLHLAAEGGHDQAVWVLLDKGGGRWDICNQDGHTALLLGYLTLRRNPENQDAARAIVTLAHCGNVEHVRDVLTQINSAVRQRHFLSSDLVNLAADGRTVKVRDELRQFANPDSRDRNGIPALVAAAGAGHASIVSMLLEAQASVDLECTPAGGNALGAARKGKHHDVVKTLLLGGASPPLPSDLQVSYFSASDSISGSYLFNYGCFGHDGKLYCSPQDCDAVGIFDPCTHCWTFLRHPDLRCGGAKYGGICASPDGKRMYCCPFKANSVLAVNISQSWGEEALYFIDLPSKYQSSQVKYMGICLGPDGKMYCAPHCASAVLVIDPASDTLSFIEGAGNDCNKYHGICQGADGRLYCGPTDSRVMLVVDTVSQSLSFIPGICSGQNKHLSICSGPDGKLYCPPHDESRVLVVNPSSSEVSYIEVGGEGGWQFGCCVAPDGRIFCAPGATNQETRNCPGVLVIDPAAQRAEYIPLPDSQGWYWGACAGPDGKLYFIPHRYSKSLLCLDPRPLRIIAEEQGGEALVKSMGIVDNVES